MISGGVAGRPRTECAHQRPKIEAYDDFYFIVFRTARNDAQRVPVHFGEVHVFLGPGFVISVRHGGAQELDV